MNSLLVIFALKRLVEYFVDSQTRLCTAHITDTNRDGNSASNPAYVAPLTKGDVFHALADVSLPTKFASRRFSFSWHSRLLSPWVNPHGGDFAPLSLNLCELLHTHPLAFGSRGNREAELLFENRCRILDTLWRGIDHSALLNNAAASSRTRSLRQSGAVVNET